MMPSETTFDTLVQHRFCDLTETKGSMRRHGSASSSPFALPCRQSVENCVCVLNNLSFQLEAEAPALFSRISSQAMPASRVQSQGDAAAIGCFSPQSKSLVQEVRREDCYATALGIPSNFDYSADTLVLSQPPVSQSRHPDSVLPSSYETGIVVYYCNRPRLSSCWK